MITQSLETLNRDNSIEVRLKATDDDTITVDYDEFQFQGGAIKSVNLVFDSDTYLQFQFQSSAINPDKEFLGFDGIVIHRP